MESAAWEGGIVCCVVVGLGVRVGVGVFVIVVTVSVGVAAVVGVGFGVLLPLSMSSVVLLNSFPCVDVVVVLAVGPSACQLSPLF